MEHGKLGKQRLTDCTKTENFTQNQRRPSQPKSAFEFPNTGPDYIIGCLIRLVGATFRLCVSAPLPQRRSLPRNPSCPILKTSKVAA